MNVSFVKMTEQDLQFVSDLYNFYVVNSTATFHIAPLDAGEIHQLVFFKDTKYCTFIVLADDIPCGYASIRSFSLREGYARTAEVGVYLQPEYTGKGIGSRAIGFLEDFARSAGFHALVASICAENRESVRLFERAGYSKCAHFREVGFKFGRVLDVVDYEKIIS